MTLTPEAIRAFQQYIFHWWSTHRRDLPWRQTRDPYRILVSEVMLQQTQVARVLPKYSEFLAQFPTVESLAAASAGDVLRLWKGMGYNRRALYLKKAAEVIVRDYNGHVPADEKTLITIPGIGPYTAAAVAVFAFEQPAVVVDTNINQIMTHFFFADQPQSKAVIADCARQLIPHNQSWEWHQALMDYGALALSQIPDRKTKTAQKQTIPFRQSKRFFRGRIMDLLRDKPYRSEEIIAEMANRYDRSEAFVAPLLEKLCAEGLIVKTITGILQLPE